MLMFLKKPNAFLASIVLVIYGGFFLSASTEAGVGSLTSNFFMVKMSGPQPTGSSNLPYLKDKHHNGEYKGRAKKRPERGLGAVEFVEFVSDRTHANTLYRSNGSTIGAKRIGRAESMKDLSVGRCGSYCTNMVCVIV